MNVSLWADSGIPLRHWLMAEPRACLHLFQRQDENFSVLENKKKTMGRCGECS